MSTKYDVCKGAALVKGPQLKIVKCALKKHHEPEDHDDKEGTTWPSQSSR